MKKIGEFFFNEQGNRVLSPKYYTLKRRIKKQMRDNEFARGYIRAIEAGVIATQSTMFG